MLEYPRVQFSDLFLFAFTNLLNDFVYPHDFNFCLSVYDSWICIFSQTSTLNSILVSHWHFKFNVLELHFLIFHSKHTIIHHFHKRHHYSLICRDIHPGVILDYFFPHISHPAHQHFYWLFFQGMSWYLIWPLNYLSYFIFCHSPSWMCTSFLAFYCS